MPRNYFDEDPLQRIEITESEDLNTVLQEWISKMRRLKIYLQQQLSESKSDSLRSSFGNAIQSIDAKAALLINLIGPTPESIQRQAQGQWNFLAYHDRPRSLESLVQRIEGNISAWEFNAESPEVKQGIRFAESLKKELLTIATELKSPEIQEKIKQVMKIFEDENGEIEVSFNKSQALFKSKNTFFLTRLNDGNFPDYQMVVPKSFATQVVIDKAGLLGAVRAASVFSSRLSDVVLKASVDDGVLEVNSSESETGEHRSLAPAKISGENVEVNFNYHYLLDALQAIPESKLFIGFNGQSKAALLRGFDSGSCFHLVMPMRIS